MTTPRNTEKTSSIARLGADLDSFFGREKELRELAAIRDEGARLVMLHGPGGVGKTRLARKLASAEATRAGIPAFFCDLTGAKVARDVALSMSRALSFSLAGSKDPNASLGKELAARGPLALVIDNCEQVTEGVALAVKEWLAAAPDLFIVATSRESLRIRGETTYAVTPLMVESEASALFIDRARKVRAGFSPRDPAVIISIVRRLEGMPLAIELAAARMRVLDEAALSSRLEEGFDVLSRGARHDDDRQASLRGAIEWSWVLLEEWEKQALSQCAVFRAGFSIEAATEVLALTPDKQSPKRDVIDVLEALLEKSLLFRIETEEPQGQPRFRMYESIRELALEKLRERGEEEKTRDRHTAYYLRAGTAWEAETWHGGVSSLRVLALELQNLLSVHERARAGKNAANALSAAIALFPIFASRGPFETFLALCDPAIDEPLLAQADPKLRARYLLVRGRARQLAGRRTESLEDFSAALSSARRAQDNALVARALVHVGTAERAAGRLTDARDRFEAALRLFQELTDLRATAVVLSTIGAIDLLRGSLSSARSTLISAVDILATLGDSATRAMVLIDFGIVEQERGDFDAAKTAFDEALLSHRAADNVRFSAIALGYRAALDDETKNSEDARDRYEEALSIATSLGDHKLCALFSAGLGVAIARLGDVERANTLFAEAGKRAALQGEPRIIATVAIQAARAKARAGTATDEDIEAARARGIGLLAESDDVRFAMRMFERVVGSRARPSIVPPPTAAKKRVLTIAEDGSYFVAPNSPRANLGKSESLRRILVALARKRVESPGSRASHEDLVTAGWPGERLDAKVGGNRLNVALARLRKDGLKELLLSLDGGHALDPEVPVVIARHEHDDDDA